MLYYSYPAYCKPNTKLIYGSDRLIASPNELISGIKPVNALLCQHEGVILSFLLDQSHSQLPVPAKSMSSRLITLLFAMVLPRAVVYACPEYITFLPHCIL
jgi:hypothetical protein